MIEISEEDLLSRMPVLLLLPRVHSDVTPEGHDSTTFKAWLQREAIKFADKVYLLRRDAVEWEYHIYVRATDVANKVFDVDTHGEKVYSLPQWSKIRDAFAKMVMDVTAKKESEGHIL